MEVHIYKTENNTKIFKRRGKKKDLYVPTRRRKIGIAKSKENKRVDCMELKWKSWREIMFKWRNRKQIKIE